jgi:signal transduction histidine kinase
MNPKLKILFLEDMPPDAELVRRELMRSDLNCVLIQLDNQSDYEQALTTECPDIILSDYYLPDCNGMTALQIATRNCPEVPFIFVSGAIGEEKAIETVTSGATDYVLKDRLSRLIPSIKRALNERKLKAQSKLAEQRVRAYQDQLRALTAELLMVEEKERHELATGLHDSIGQLLGIIKIELVRLEKNESAHHLQQSITAIKGLLNQAINETRSLTFELSPPSLYSIGFEAAIEELVENLQKVSDLNFHTSFQQDSTPLSKNMKVLLYRSIRELIANVIKHADARNVFLTVSQNEGHVEAVIEDDGKGFDTSVLKDESNSHEGFGLFSIEERLFHVGGKMEIESNPSQGTKVKLNAPVKIRQN